MKKMYFRNLMAFFVCALCCSSALAQVSTNFNNSAALNAAGRFAKNYKQTPAIELPALDHERLLRKEEADKRASAFVKPFQIAEPVTVDIDVVSRATWTGDEQFAFGKLTIRAAKARSVSINFDKFHLPAGSELYVYNENGEMITGPVTEKENNENNTWGSWVYKGELITVEVRTPVATRQELQLHISNVAYGYKDIYRTKVADFGASGSCNINVLCPEGAGWEAERNAVALILNSNGTSWCSGSMLMNSASTPAPYFLTADHCYVDNPDVANWRYIFQAWSPTCTPSQNSNGVQYFGSALRSRWAPTDFCLVELSQTPPCNSGIHYAGWSRSATPATSAMCIHHPRGDVMKLAVAGAGAVRDGYFGSGPANHWRAHWTAGVTEPGSSGSPLFDQNHRVIGQLHGGPSSCTSSQMWDYYGSFDLSWDGGGTSATRLRDWLDPVGSNPVQTNTTNRSGLPLNFSPVTGISEQDHSVNCRTPKFTYTAVGGAGATNFKWYTQRISPNPASSFTLVKDGPSNFYTRGTGVTPGQCEEFLIKVVASNCDGTVTSEATTEAFMCRCVNPLALTKPSEQLKVTPNPATSTVQIQLSGDASTSTASSKTSIQLIRIVTKEGVVKKLITGNRLNNFMLSVTDLPADIYTVLVYDGRQWVSSKLIKK